MTSTLTAQRLQHETQDPHVRGRWLSDVVLGAQDGIVNTLGVVLGVAAAAGDVRIVFATGMAAALAESISMAAVAYTSSVARADLYRAERERELRHLDRVPDVERGEIRDLFFAKGFRGELLERAVEVVCSNRETWVDMMMAEEHRLAPLDRQGSRRSAAVVGGASAIASTLPVIPFLFCDVSLGMLLSLACGALLLMMLGALKARMTVGSPARSAVTLMLIGLSSAGAGYLVGSLFSVR